MRKLCYKDPNYTKYMLALVGDAFLTNYNVQYVDSIFKSIGWLNFQYVDSIFNLLTHSDLIMVCSLSLWFFLTDNKFETPNIECMMMFYDDVLQPTTKNFINGKLVESKTNKWIDVHNPVSHVPIHCSRLPKKINKFLIENGNTVFSFILLKLFQQTLTSFLKYDQPDLILEPDFILYLILKLKGLITPFDCSCYLEAVQTFRK